MKQQQGDTVAAWLGVLDASYPPEHAASWDNVGLQVGDPDWPTRRVLTTLDVTGAVLREAAEIDHTLVVAHHPLLFRPLTALTPSSASGRLALQAAGERLAVAAAHTNLDVAQDGTSTSQPVADVLGLIDARPLTTHAEQGRRCKLVTFVPPESLDAVIDAVSNAGAGRLGDYERCTFRVRGTGTFRPLPGADPYSGTVGVDAAESEDRLEVELATGRIGAVVGALISAHPYEEVAYDLVPLLDGADVGFGVVGRLPEPRPLRDVAERIRQQLPAPHLRFAGDPERVVQVVATVGGAGDGLIPAATAAGADVYVTGDLRHHVALDAVEQGLALVDAGHHATEAAAIPAWTEQLRRSGQRRGLVAPVVASQVPTVPWR